MTRPLATVALCALALAACSETDDPAPAPVTEASPAPASPSTALTSFPEIDIDKHSEAPVRAELDRFRSRAVANPMDATSVGNLGMKCFIYDYGTEALACFQRATELDPESTKWSYYLGFAYENVGEQADAIDAYERVIELDPSYQPAYTRLATLLLDAAPDRACELFARAAELTPDEARSTWGLAQCARTEGDLERAESLYREAIRLEPTYGAAHFGLAQVLARSGRTDEAELHFTLQKVGRDPSDYRDPLAVQLALAERGSGGAIREAQSRLQRGDVAGASERLLDAMAAMPNVPALRLQLAQIRLQSGEFESAKTLIASVLEDVPGNNGARSMRAAIHVTENEPDEARALLEEILRDDPDEAASNWLLGRLLADQGEQEAAIEHMTRGADLQAFNPGVQIQMAQMMGQLGRLREAAMYLRRAAIAQQGNQELLDEAARLDRLADESSPREGE